MLRAQLIVVAAIALLMAQVQCAAACAADFSGGRTSVPPCHQHRGPSPDRMPDGCPHRTILTPAIAPQAPQAASPPVLATAPAAAVPLAVPALLRSAELVLAASSPPEGRALSAIVLRI